MKGLPTEPHNPGRSPRATLEKLARIVSGDYGVTVAFGEPPARLERDGIVLPQSQLDNGELSRLTGTLDLLIARRLYAAPRGRYSLPGPFARAIGRVLDDHRCCRRLLADYPGADRYLHARRQAESERLARLPFAVNWEVRYLDVLTSTLWDDATVDVSPVRTQTLAQAITQSIAPTVAPMAAMGSAADDPVHQALQATRDLIVAARTARSAGQVHEIVLQMVGRLRRFERAARSNQAGTDLDEERIDDAYAEPDATAADRSSDSSTAADEMTDEPPSADENDPADVDALAEFEPDLEALLEEDGDTHSGGDGTRRGQPSSGGSRATPTSRRVVLPLFSVPLTRQFDQVTDHSGRGDRLAWSTLRRDALRATGKLSEKLERALRADEPNAWRYEQERGQINPAGLAKVVTQPRYRTPFKVERPVPSRNVAISILVDLSASMAGEKLEIARLCAAALASVLSRLGFGFEVLGFSSRTDPEMREFYRQQVAARVSMKPYNRLVERLDLQVFKSFAVDDLSGIVNMTCGEQNPDGECLSWAAERLLARRGERHVMFVLSDGHPVTGDGNKQVLQSDLKRRIQGLRDEGVELVGIGIGDDAAATYYEKAIVVRDLAALPVMAFDQLSSTLLARRRSLRS